jgi:hypothetical protein
MHVMEMIIQEGDMIMRASGVEVQIEKGSIISDIRNENPTDERDIIDTGLVPKVRHFGLQFLIMGGASDGYGRKGPLNRGRLPASSQTERNDTAGQYGSNETAARKSHQPVRSETNRSITMVKTRRKRQYY